MSASEARVVTATGKDGSDMQLTIATTPEFEFKPGEIVHFSKSLRNGKVALIRGLADGLLWFSVFATKQEALQESAVAAPVEATSCRVKAEFIRQYGWVVDDEVNKYAQ